MPQQNNRSRYAAHRLIIHGMQDKVNNFDQTLPSGTRQLKSHSKIGNMALKKTSVRSDAPSIFAHDGSGWARTSLHSPSLTIGSQDDLYHAFLEAQAARNRITRVFNLDPSDTDTVKAALNQAPAPGESGVNVCPDHIVRHTGGGNNEPGDSPFDLPARTASAKNGIEPAVLFKQQACWQTVGAENRASFDYKGEGVTVVVLDAAPDVQRISPELVNYYIGMKGAQIDYPNVEDEEKHAQEVVGMGRIQPPVVARPGDSDVDPLLLKPYHGVLGASLIRELAPKAKIVLVEVLNDEGETTGSTLSEAIDYVLYLQEQKVTVNGERLIGDKVIFNMSLGIERSLAEGVEAPYLLAVCERICESGAVLVAAAGNDSYYLHPRNPEEPAAYGYFGESHRTYDQVIAVSATSYKPGEYALYSNRGNFAAPGMDVLMDTGDSANPANSRYVYWVGTSFAAPIVTGAATVLLSAGVPANSVKQALWLGTERPAHWSYAPEINTARSLQFLQQGKLS